MGAARPLMGRALPSRSPVAGPANYRRPATGRGHTAPAPVSERTSVSA
jgi:hypothetical protein